MKILFATMTLVLFFSSCATMRDFFGFEDEKPPAPIVKEEVEKEPLTKYSEISNFSPSSDRQYKRMTKEKLEEDSELHAGAGSLWVMEGQTSYLFAQNKRCREGDPTALKVEGIAMKQVQMKAETVKDLLIELENQKKMAEEKKRKEEEAQKRLADIETEKRSILAKNEADNEELAQTMAEQRITDRKPASVVVVEPPKDPNADKINFKDVATIPMKITEKLDNGQYRISGQQFITIKNRPYKLIATGVVRGEDYDDQMISSEKLYDPQFDLVHIKKAE